MSREITISGSIEFVSLEGGGGQELSSGGNLPVSVPDPDLVNAVEQERPIGQNEIELGDAMIRMWCRNLDGLRDVHVLEEPEGDPFLLLRPGYFCNVRWTAASEPTLVAPSGTPVVELVTVRDLT